MEDKDINVKPSSQFEEINLNIKLNTNIKNSSITSSVGMDMSITPKKGKKIIYDEDEKEVVVVEGKVENKINNKISKHYNENMPLHINMLKKDLSNADDFPDLNDAISTTINLTPDKQDPLDKLTDSFIYCREKERDYILKFIHDPEVKTLFICGQPGTGKTSLMTEIFNTQLNNKVAYSFRIYINCMSVNSIKDFNDEIFRFFNKTVNLIALKALFSNKPKRYLEIVKMLKLNIGKEKTLSNFLNLLTESKIGDQLTPIILLDEIDHFYQKNNDISFFDIMSIPYISSSNLKIIMISNNSEFDKYIFPKIENRKIKINKYVFQPYSHVEINKILLSKLEEMDMMKHFEENAVRFIASKLANKSGDIRPALEIIKQIILNNKTEFENENENKKKVDLREVMVLLKHKQSQFTELIKHLTFEQKVVVSSIYFGMNGTATNILSEDEILKQYRIIKRENFNNEINLRDYEEVMKSLLDLGIIVKLRKSKQCYKVEPKMEEIQLIFGEDERLFNMFRSVGGERVDKGERLTD